jgi:hypothetical protein
MIGFMATLEKGGRHEDESNSVPTGLELESVSCPVWRRAAM